MLLGKPGVGKTTLLREAARILSEKKRVVVVDTSNEIGGDGDIPHPAIGKARRMQVAAPEFQHEVMIEAVENHMPEVVVIDEIGREQEAAAARTIAERGVQLVGTAHGITLDNLLMNPTLSDLVGGIESVTLSDEEARRRGTQKAVLERHAPPPSTCSSRSKIASVWRYIIMSRLRWMPCCAAATWRLRFAIAMRRGRCASRPRLRCQPRHGERGTVFTGRESAWTPGAEGRLPFDKRQVEAQPGALSQPTPAAASQPTQTVRIYPYGVGRGRLAEATQNLGVPVAIVDALDEANAVVTLKNYYRKHPEPVAEAERRRIPVYVLHANTIHQMEACLGDIFGLQVEYEDPVERAVTETQEAIRRVLGGSRSEDLRPAERGHPPAAARNGPRGQAGLA